MAQSKLFKQPKFCLDCGEEITGRAGNARRCARCLGPAYLEKLEAAKERHKLQRRGLYVPRPAPRPASAPVRRGPYLDQERRGPNAAAFGRDYIGQAQSKDGKYYTCLYQGRWIRIKKVCTGCGRDDSEVRGKWAPIFSEFDYRGREARPTLLCLDCYDQACDGAGQQQQREAS